MMSAKSRAIRLGERAMVCDGMQHGDRNMADGKRMDADCVPRRMG